MDVDWLNKQGVEEQRNTQETTAADADRETTLRAFSQISGEGKLYGVMEPPGYQLESDYGEGNNRNKWAANSEEQSNAQELFMGIRKRRAEITNTASVNQAKKTKSNVENYSKRHRIGETDLRTGDLILVTDGQKVRGPNGKLTMKYNRGPHEVVKICKSQVTYTETRKNGKERQKIVHLKMAKKFRKR